MLIPQQRAGRLKINLFIRRGLQEDAMIVVPLILLVLGLIFTQAARV